MPQRNRPSCTTNFYPRPPRGGRQRRPPGRREARGFLSTPSARRATTKNILHRIIYPLFLSTPSARRATGRLCLTVPIPTISIHALREEGDPSSSPLAIASANFYPRPPRGGRQRCPRFQKMCFTFLSTPSARRATPLQGTRPATRYPFLSTPSARRATTVLFRICAVLCNFYPRPPRGGRPTSLPSTTPASSFLSTPSARRATILATLLTYALRNFYPRPPRGGRPGALVCKISSGAISIHALREESDVEIIIPQSVQKISIHALREEGDVRLKNKATGGKDFYPRPPRGGRPTRKRPRMPA